MQKLIIAGLTASLLAACSSTKEPAPVESRTATPTASSTTADLSAPASQTAPVSPSAPTASALAPHLDPANKLSTDRSVYFDFDQYVVKDEFRNTVESHAKYLTEKRELKIKIEGNADERGSREYNLALGQKRAQAVVKALTLVGAGEAQLEAVSFGKERPVSDGHDEAAWAKNRRVELKDR